MIQQNRIIRGTILLSLSLFGLALVWLFLSGVSTVQATPPIEGNPVSMGSASAMATTLSPARAVAAADLDQNVRPDLAFGQSGSLQSAENACDAAFDDTGVVVGPLDPAKGLVIGDLDGGGHPDIVTYQRGEDEFHYLHIRENDGNPFSANWPEYNFDHVNGGIEPRALADIDGDGDLDIVATRPWVDQRLEIWQNNGDPFGTSWPSPHLIDTPPGGVSALAVGDLDDNGTLEIVGGIQGNESISPTIEIWRFEGDPFASSWISAEVAVVYYTVHSIALDDLDNDGRLDIVFGTHHAPPVPPDELLDVYQLRAAPNDGTPFDGGWTLFDLGRDPQWTGIVPTHGYFGATVWSVDVADFDDDGYLDIVTGGGIEGDHQVMVWKNDGAPFDGEQWQPTTTGLGPWWESQGTPWLSGTVRSVVAADFNGDGLIDVVSGSDTPEYYKINYWENSGIPFSELVTDTHWIRHHVGVLDGNVQLVGAADFDSDGDLDIASLTDVATGNPAVHVWQNKTAGCIADLNVEANPSSIPADGTSTSLVTATVEYAYGNSVVNGTVVTFSTTLGSFPTDPYTTTTLSGVATATLVAPTSVGTALITAAANSKIATTTVTFTAGSLHHIAVSPAPAVLTPNATQLFTATGYDQYDNEISGLSFTWSVVNGGGTIDSNGVFTAGPTAGTYPDTVRAKAEGISGYASVTVTAGALNHIVVTPSSVTLAPEGTQSFTATGYDQYDNEISGLSFTWSVVNGGGTVDSNGVFTAGPTAGTYPDTVQATAEGISGYASVTVTAGALNHIVVTPSSVTLAPEEVHPFTATGYDQYENEVSGLSSTWSVVNGGGSIDSNGVFTAGTIAETYTDIIRTTANSTSDYGQYDNQISGLSFTWSVVNGGGSIDSNGVFTAGPTAGTYTDTVRAKAEGISGYASVTIAAGEADEYLIFLPLVLTGQ